MEVKGITQKVYPKESGVSKTGKEWSKQGIVITVPDRYPYSLYITDFSDKAGFSKVKEGDTVTVSANVSSREFNGKWYTEVMAWKCDVEQSAPKSPVIENEPDGDDLPF